MNPRRTAARAATTLAANALLLAVPGTASAGIPGVARANVTFADVWNGSHTAVVGVRACATGSVDDGPFVAGAWTYALVGVRANGSTFTDVQAPLVTSSYSRCTTVNFNGQPSGALTVNLTYQGAAVDLATWATGYAFWDPLLPGTQWGSTGT